MRVPGGPMTGLAADPVQRAQYQAIIDGEHRDGERGRLLFVVSTDVLAEGKGDLFVGLGMARALRDDGWGVSLWPTPRYDEPTPDDIDVVIVMIESYVPGLVPADSKVIGWVRNWTDDWAAQPYLEQFSQLWCSSSESAAALAAVYPGRIEVVPLAVDEALFAPRAVERRSAVVTTANFWGVERSLSSSLELVSQSVPVDWYGANSRHLKLASSIHHHDSIDYFALPGVYSQWLIVVDDLIDAAARYGNQNSRLFDALACGAIVVTNGALGLDELGLGDVPVYRGPQDLQRIVNSLVGDREEAADLAARLQSVVLSRHRYQDRARSVRAALTDLVQAPRDAVRPALLEWGSHEREKLRAARGERDQYLVMFGDVSREVARLAAESAERLEEINHLRSSRVYRVARRLGRIGSGVRRRLPGRAG